MALRRAAVLALVLSAAALSACGAAHPPDPRSGTRVVHVVAGENVWGDIARQIGGRHASVSSILSDPRDDPHLYESTPHDAGEVATANVVIVNGAGYDDFMDRLVDASSGDGRHVLNVARVVGLKGSDPNPHVFYDVARVPDVAARIAAALTLADPADAATFRANLRRFAASFAPIATTVQAIRNHAPGAPVAYTERVARDLLVDAGLTVKTPDGFARAVEEGNEPSASDTQAMDAVITEQRARVLLNNTQATSPVTKHVATLATRAGIPVVGVTETLPPGLTYQAWQLRQTRALLGALERNP